MLLRPMQDYNKEDLASTHFIATVVDNDDPQKLARVKIRIPELHGTSQDITDDLLPWAAQLKPAILGGGTGLSFNSIPRIGTEVVILHMRGDLSQPAYAFELTSKSTESSKLLEDYPNSYSFEDSDGNYYHVNMEQDKLDILFNGNKILTVTNNRDTSIGGNDSLDVSGNRSALVEKDSQDDVVGDRYESTDKNKVTQVSQDNYNIVGGSETSTISGNSETSIGGSLSISVTGSANISVSGSCQVTGSTISLNGSGGKVVTTESTNPLTGTPFPSGSTTVFAGDGV